jgi:HPt (histidine-containing phosphotransfer) domain-containing protein
MKKISYAKLALSLLLVSTVLVGCGKGTNSVSTQTSLTSPATVAQYPQLQAIDSAFEELKTEQKTFIDNLNQAINITDKKDRESITSDKVSKKIENLQQKIKEYRQNQMPKLKEGEKASVEQILDSIDNTLEEISQKVINPFKTGLTRDAIENVQKQLDFFTRRNISQNNYGNFGDTTVEEITKFLQDKQKSLEDNIKQLKSPIDPEIQKLSNRIAQLEKEKTSSNTTFLVAILALLASVISLLRSRKKLRQSFSIRNLSSVLKFWNRGTNPAGKLTEENIDNSSTQVDTQNLSTNETQLYYEIYVRVYNDIYKKLSEKFKYIEQKITQENRIINNRIADLEVEKHNRKTKDTKVREQKEPTGITTLNPSEPPASQTYQSTAPSVSSSSHSLVGDNYDQDARSSSLIEVSPTEESLANREMGGTDPIVLKNKRRGYYEVYLDGNYHCLVPSQNFRINQNNYKSVEDLFECQNYDPNYSDSYIVIRPAVVYPLAGGQTWQLQQRGVLRF